MFIERLLEKSAKAGTVSELPGKKFHALVWRIDLPELPGPLLAVEPQTYMNESGKAIKPLMEWHNLEPNQLMAVQDELDLPAGALRLKYGGGLAGHNGLASIRALLGTADFYRLRIGIGKPQQREEVINWVLTKPAPEDFRKITKALSIAVDAFLVFCVDGMEAATRFIKSESA